MIQGFREKFKQKMSFLILHMSVVLVADFPYLLLILYTGNQLPATKQEKKKCAAKSLETGWGRVYTQPLLMLPTPSAPFIWMPV